MALLQYSLNPLTHHEIPPWPGSPRFRETLLLDSADAEQFVLTRVAGIDGGPQATLEAGGAEPAATRPRST